MRISIPFLLSVSVLGLAAQQTSPPVFQAEGNLVVIPTQVLDQETRQPIVGLARSDFRVFDDSSPVDLTVFDNSPAQLNMLLLVDVSGGFTNQNIGVCVYALYRSLTGLDRVSVISFSDGPPRRRVDFTSDEHAIRTGWNLVFDKDRNNGRRVVKTSRMFDAINAAALYLLETPKVRRPAIVVVTHNREAKSKTRQSTAMENLLESSANLEAIILPQEPFSLGYSFGGIVRGGSKHSSGTPAPPKLLEDLGSIEPFPKATGGQVLRLDLAGGARTVSGVSAGADWAATTIDPLVKDLMSRLRSQYILGIRGSSAREHQFRPLSVQLTEDAQHRYPRAVIHARSGYWAALKETDAKK
jgi:hypothetical protein